MTDSIHISKYLRRIGASCSGEPSVAKLQQLTLAHLKTVPFENLDPVNGKLPSLDTRTLFEKIVERGRGGYCFELNKLFYLLLQELGFTCYPVAARVLVRLPAPCPLSHRGIVVELEGKKYFCDVGFGGHGPRGIVELERKTKQMVHGEAFTVLHEGDTYTLCTWHTGTEKPLISFRDIPWQEIDFEPLNLYQGKRKESIFTQKILLYRTMDEGWEALVGNLYNTMHNGTFLSREIDSYEEWIEIFRLFELPINSLGTAAEKLYRKR